MSFLEKAREHENAVPEWTNNPGSYALHGPAADMGIFMRQCWPEIIAVVEAARECDQYRVPLEYCDKVPRVYTERLRDALDALDKKADEP